uniref:Uncharacterized protein n=1 Tax=Romanomermis culicivorax TaxID=13658 RepID=A0A915HY02_ROMCU
MIRPEQRLSAKDKLCLEFVEEMAQLRLWKNADMCTPIPGSPDTITKDSQEIQTSESEIFSIAVGLPAEDDLQYRRLNEDVTEL